MQLPISLSGARRAVLTLAIGADVTTAG